MTAILPGNLTCVLAGILLCAGIVRAQEGGDLRDLRVGMSIAAIPAGEYIDLSCVGTMTKRSSGGRTFANVRGTRRGCVPLGSVSTTASMTWRKSTKNTRGPRLRAIPSS